MYNDSIYRMPQRKGKLKKYLLFWDIYKYCKTMKKNKGITNMKF